MKLSDYLKWLKANWPMAGLVLAFYLTIFLLVFVRPVNLPVFLILLQTPLYLLHEAEEYIFPGGFLRFFNRDIFRMPHDDEPLDENFSFWVNILLIWVLLPLFGFLSLANLNLGLWVPYFTIFAGVSHIAMAIKARKRYNPGLIVSLVLNIPAGSAVVWYLYTAGILASPFVNIHILIGLGLNLLLPVIGAIKFNGYKRKHG